MSLHACRTAPNSASRRSAKPPVSDSPGPSSASDAEMGASQDGDPTNGSCPFGPPSTLKEHIPQLALHHRKANCPRALVVPVSCLTFTMAGSNLVESPITKDIPSNMGVSFFGDPQNGGFPTGFRLKIPTRAYPQKKDTPILHAHKSLRWILDGVMHNRPILTHQLRVLATQHPQKVTT